MAMITVNQLSKHFKVYKHRRGAVGAFQNLFNYEHSLVRAVDNIKFTIQAGELVGYIGPNGAGKSTTIKMLSGLLVPTSGDLLVNGYIPWKDRQHYVASIGAVFGQRTSLWWDLPVIESLNLLKYIYRVPDARFTSNLNNFRQLLELDPFLDTPVRVLSLGQRMRADICAALLHDPKILFLDEPTIGLDVVAKERIRKFIQHINKEFGITIILTTHDLSDVEKLCQRILIIDQGKLLYDGGLNQLKTRFGGKRHLVVEFSEKYLDTSVDGAKIIDDQDLVTTYSFQRDTITASALIGRISKNFRIRDLEVREPDIETTIRRIYEQRLLQ